MQQPPIVVQSSAWDPNDHKYRCCCQNCHITRGAFIIGIVEAIGLAINLLNSFIRVGQYGSSYGGQLAGALVGDLISGICIGLLFYGLKREKPGFLLPHLFLQVMAIILLFIIAILVIILLAVGSLGALAGFVGDNGEMKDVDKNQLTAALVIAGIIFVVVMFLVAFFQIWFFTIILGAYRFLKEKLLYGTATVSYPAMESGPPSYPGFQTPVDHK